MALLTLTERNRLRRLFLQNFDKDEIKGFYFDLALEVDHLEASSREKLVADLLRHLDHQTRLSELFELASTLRPLLHAELIMPANNPAPAPIASSVFISYSHRDENWKARLHNHLSRVIAAPHISAWHDQNSNSLHYPQMLQALENCQIAIILISAHFLSSECLLMQHMPKLLALQQQQRVQLYPLILKPCTWQLVDWLTQVPIYPAPDRYLSAGNEGQIELDLANFAKEIDETLKRYC